MPFVNWARTGRSNAFAILINRLDRKAKLEECHTINTLILSKVKKVYQLEVRDITWELKMHVELSKVKWKFSYNYRIQNTKKYR